jgi:hypothetical protein
MAAPTVVQRTTFTTTGTVTSAAALGTVTGTFYKRRYGPLIGADGSVGDKGWSADLRGNTSHLADITAAPFSLDPTGTSTNAQFGFEFWVYINSVNHDGTNHPELLIARDQAGNQMGTLIIKNVSGTLYLQHIGGTLNSNYTGLDFSTPILLSSIYRRWVQFRIVVQKTAATAQTVELMYRFSGSGTFTSLINYGSVSNGNRMVSIGGGSNRRGGSSSAINARYGLPTYFTIATWATDRAVVITDSYDPTWPNGTQAKRPVWYWDTVGGNDTNNGDASNAAFATLTDIATASANATFFYPLVEVQNRDGSASTAFPNGVDAIPSAGNQIDADVAAARVIRGDLVLGGDIVYIVHNSGAEQRATGSIALTTPGLTVQSTSLAPSQPATIIFLKQLTGVSKTAGKTYTYQTTDVSLAGGIHSALYQSRRIFQNVAGANYAAVGTTIDATKGTYWSDGTTMYFRPFNDVDPTVSANQPEFERTCTTPYSGPTGLYRKASNQMIRNLVLAYTEQDQVNSLSNSGGYASGLDAGGNVGLSISYGVTTSDTDKHGQMDASSTTFVRSLYIDCYDQLGDIGGGASSFGLYNDGGVGTENAQGAWINCATIGFGAGKAGDARGRIFNDGNNGGFIQVHNAGGAYSSVQKIFITGCRSPGGGVPVLQLSGCTYTIKGSSFVAFGSNPGNGSAGTGTFYSDCDSSLMATLDGSYVRCAWLLRDTLSDNTKSPFRIDPSGNPASFKNLTVTDSIFDLTSLAGIASWLWLSSNGAIGTFTRVRFILPAGLAIIDYQTATTAANPGIKFVNCVFETSDGTAATLFRNANTGGGAVSLTLAQAITAGICDPSCSVTTTNSTTGGVWPISTVTKRRNILIPSA